MGIQINGQTDTVTSTTAGGSVKVTPLAASTGLNVGTGASISSPATNVLALGTNSAERVRINSSGNVGVGTYNPEYKLHISGGSIYHNGTGSLPLYINANGSSGDPDRLAYLHQSVSDTAASILLSGKNSSNVSTHTLLTSSNDGNFYISPGNYQPSQTPKKFTITSSGSVGIGTDNPQAKFHSYSTTESDNRFEYFTPTTLSTSTIAAQFKTSVTNLAVGARTGFSFALQEGTNNYVGAYIQSVRENTSHHQGLVFSTWNGGAATPQDRVKIDKDGRVNINTQTSYTYGLLTVQGGNAADAGNVNGLFVRGNGTNTSCPIYFNDEFGYPQKSIYQESYYLKIRGHNNEGVWILGSNASTNPSTNYKFNGTNNGSQCFNASNTTTWNTTSDQRIKENVEDLVNALNKIKQIRPVTFDYTDEYAEHRSWNICNEDDEKIGINTCMKHHNVGYIAQEYKEVFPNDVTMGPEDIGDTHYEDFHQLQPNSVVPYLVKAVQELSAEVETLKAKIVAAGL